MRCWSLGCEGTASWFLRVSEKFRKSEFYEKTYSNTSEYHACCKKHAKEIMMDVNLSGSPVHLYIEVTREEYEASLVVES
jgi:hypothetical protein